MNLPLRVARVGFGLLQSVSTRAAGAVAERLFFSPGRSRVPPAGREVLRRGERFWLLADGHRVAAWRWGAGPVVALVHGWGSRAGRLAGFVEPLLRDGFGVVAFDAPGHGESEGSLGSAPQAARALQAVAAACGPLYGVVGHSLGTTAAVLALTEGLQAERAVFIAPPLDIAVYAERFAATMGLSPATVAEMRRRSERRLRFDWRSLRVLSVAPELARVALLVCHDVHDRDIGWEDGAALAQAWPGASLVTTRGLGHHRIARDPAVIAHAVTFLAAGRPEGRDGAGAEQAWLERSLFDRESRVWRAW